MRVHMAQNWAAAGDGVLSGNGYGTASGGLSKVCPTKGPSRRHMCRRAMTVQP